MAFLTAAAIATLAAAAINGGISLYANHQSQQAMERYRNALAADRSRAAQNEDYLSKSNSETVACCKSKTNTWFDSW